MNKKGKVAIIGVGHVGSTLANSLVVSNTIDTLYLAGSSQEKLWAEKIELLQCGVVVRSATKIIICQIEECMDADIIVISASEKYITGRMREDFLISSSNILHSIFSRISSYDGIVIIVTNPVDFVTYYSIKTFGLNSNKIIGTGTVLDSYRLRASCGVTSSTWCVGEHGGMLFVPRAFQNDLLLSNEELVKNIVDNNIDANTIMKIKGMTNWAIVAVISEIIQVILNDFKTVLPVSRLIQFPFLKSEVCIGYPAYIGRNGIEALIDLPLTDDEQLIIREISNKQKCLYDFIQGISN